MSAFMTSTVSALQASSLLRRTHLLPGESLPSLLERLTRLNYYSHSHTLKHICNERLEASMDQDDLTCPRRVDTFLQLAQLTGISTEDLFAASRHRFAGVLLLPHQSPEKINWVEKSSKNILSRGQAQGHLRSGAAAQYCPVCLKTSAYHRLNWTPSAVAICLDHLCWLVDSCPQCKKQLSIREIVWRQCQACRADLCTAETISVAGDEVGILSQQMIQSWLEVAKAPESPARYGLPRSRPVILYHLLESLCHRLLVCSEGWLLFPDPLKGLSAHLSPSPHYLQNLNPEQTYYLHRAAFTGMLNWPQGLFQILDAYSGRYSQDPISAKSKQRLERIRCDWFKSSWSGPDYHFLKQAYVVYLLKRGLPIRISMAHRFKNADWFVESTGIWTEERTAQALNLSLSDLHRFCPLGSLKECIWSSSPTRGSLFKSDKVLAVQNRWRSGWSISDASCWLGIPELDVIHLVERNQLALPDRAKKKDPALWVFNRKMVEDFFQKVVDRLVVFSGDPFHLCHLFEIERCMLSIGIDCALIVQQVAEGVLPAYKTRPGIHSLEDICFLDEGVDAMPDRL
jgi:hypothetical protein